MTDLNTPGGGGPNDPKSEINELVTESGKELGGTLKEQESEGSTKRIDKLVGDKEAILKDLKENHVKVEENVEYMGYKGKKVHIDLQAVGKEIGKFEGFTIDFFVSYDLLTKGDFENDNKLRGKSFTKNEIIELGHKLSQYMNALGVAIEDNFIGYDDGTELGNYFKDITGLNELYWIKEYLGIWFCRKDHCSFTERNKYDDHIGYLFLKI